LTKVHLDDPRDADEFQRELAALLITGAGQSTPQQKP
jgi:hypothetical protein